MKYDAFISYSHEKDSPLAANLEKALEKFAKPAFKRRALNLFRDQNDLSASPDLWGKIKEGLSDSNYFIFLASPKSGQSIWCNKEVDYWIKNKPVENLLIALTDGELIWNDASNDFDWTKTDAIPENLSKVFKSEPLYVDFRDNKVASKQDLSNSDFRAKTVLLAATIHGKSVGDMDGEGIKQHKKTIRYRNGAVIGLSMLMVLALFLAYLANTKANESAQNADDAKKSEERAKKNELLALKAKNEAELQLVFTKLESYMSKSQAYEERNELKAFRYAEKGYQLAKANNLETREFANQIIHVVYQQGLFPVRNKKTPLKDTLQKVDFDSENKLHVVEHEIIETDKKGIEVQRYADAFLGYDPYYTNDGKFVMVRNHPEGGEVAGSGYTMYSRDGKKLLQTHSRLYIDPFLTCPFFFDQASKGVVVFDDDHDVVVYPIDGSNILKEDKFQIEGFGNKTSAMCLSPSGKYFVSASEDGRIMLYNDLALSRQYYHGNESKIEFDAHHNEMITEVSFCNNETLLKTVTKKGTKYWPLNKSIQFKTKYNKDFRFENPYSQETLQFDVDVNESHSNKVSSKNFKLTNKAMFSTKEEILIWLDFRTSDLNRFEGAITPDECYLFANQWVYPLDVELILKLVNEKGVLGRLEEVNIE